MKKILLLLATVAVMYSCGTTQKEVSIKSIAGEWNIVTVDGKVLAPAEEIPFIGFNIADTLVYGSTGCNQLTGTLNADAETGTIDFSALGSTRRMCADMQTEETVLGALARVKSFNIATDGKLQLLDADKKTVVELELRK